MKRQNKFNWAERVSRKDIRRLFKQSHSYSQVQKIAAELALNPNATYGFLIEVR